MADFLQLRNISKNYSKLPAPVLNDINLRIALGDRIAILGASGSGKTTLLHLLGLLFKAEQGEILIKGEDAQNWSEKVRSIWRNENLGYVFQDFGLIPELNLQENIELPLRIAGRRVSGQEGKRLLAQVGLAGRENSFPSEVSGGESQRVAIARALVGNPKLVLADEPTGNLQKQQGEQIAELFNQLQDELGFSLVVATHNEELAKLLQARIFRLSSGMLQIDYRGE